MTDPALDAASYYRDFTVLKVHLIFLTFFQNLSCLPSTWTSGDCKTEGRLICHPYFPMAETFLLENLLKMS